MLIYFIFGQ